VCSNRRPCGASITEEHLLGPTWELGPLSRQGKERRWGKFLGIAEGAMTWLAGRSVTGRPASSATQEQSRREAILFQSCIRRRGTTRARPRAPRRWTKERAG